MGRGIRRLKFLQKRYGGRRWRKRKGITAVRLANGSIRQAEVRGGSDDLELRKVYRVLPDRAAVREGYVRVIDESGEDYLHPADYFAPVRLPVAIARELRSPRNEALPLAAHRARRA